MKLKMQKSKMISQKALVDNINVVEKHTDDYKFDAFIEKLQEIMIEDEFEILKDEFFDKYCDEFEDKEENKFSYMDVFKNYTLSIETYIENV